MFTRSATAADSESAGSTWQQWRGSNRDSLVSGDWPKSISEANLVQQWRVPLGPSYSGPVVDEKCVYTTETRDKATEHVLAYDRLTGEKLWETDWVGAISVPFFAKSNGDWIRSTPLITGDRLLVAGIRDHLVCLNKATGSMDWEIDFPKQFNDTVPGFGCVCSPLVDGEFVYMQAGGGLAKINLADGSIVWQVLDDGGEAMDSAFSSPIIAEMHGKRQLLVQMRTKLVGVDLETGATIWEKEIAAFRGMNILTPTVIDSKVFTSSYGGKAWLFDVQPNDSTNWEVAEAWDNKVQAYMSSPVVVDGFIYLHLRNQRFTCIDAETGEGKWTTRPYGKYWSMISNGRQILALDQTGKLRLIDPSQEEFRLVEERTVSESETWAHLAMADDQLFIRELDGLTAWKWS
jgi:outer membrane protein assembly factor BamB